MSAHRDPDRITRAWLDLMPDEAPERVIAAVLLVVDDTPQVRRPLVRGPRRSARMHRFALLAAAAVLGASLVGGALLIGGGSPRTPQPTTAPPGSIQPSSGPASVAPSASAATPDALRATWVADATPIDAIPASGPTIRLVINNNGSGIWVRASDTKLTAVRSSLGATAADELTLVLDRADAGCAAGDTGRYRWVVSPDGLTLALTAIEDACAPRQLAVERTWVRSHMGPSTGGRAVLDAFDPAFLLTLPVGSWVPKGYPGAMESLSTDLAIYAVKDPQGFSDPCEIGGGTSLPIAQGLDAFETYIRKLPGYTVTATDLTIGGYPARHLAITTVPTAACPAGDRIIAWGAKSDPGGTSWFLGAGDPDSIYVIQLPTTTILFQLLPQNGVAFDDAPTLASIRFLDSIAAAATPSP